MRGGLIAVFIWIVVQMLVAGVVLCDLLFGVIIGTGYVDTIFDFGWAGIDWSLWPVVLAEIVQLALLVALNFWLLRKFFQRSQTFTFSFISVLALTALLNLMLAAIYQVTVGEVPAMGGTALAVALGAYQYLCNSPRGKAVFGTA